MFVFKPAIWRNGVLTELPRPVTSVRIQDTWDFARFKVPLREGDSLAGPSRNGVDIALEGRCGTYAGEIRSDEQSMFTTLEQLRSSLHRNAGDDPFQFFLYHDPATSTYRSFRSCSTVRFEYDLSDPRLFTFTVTIHADDPVIHTGPPV